MLETGEYRIVNRIKADATPIDDVTKFAWDDDDYETATEWHDFTPDEMEHQREKAVSTTEYTLHKADYISAKLGDALMYCTTVEEILATLSQFRAKYGAELEQRQAWRDEINELEGMSNGET